jgi:hypothetical protein
MFPKREQNPFCFTQDFLGKLGGGGLPFLELESLGEGGLPFLELESFAFFLKFTLRMAVIAACPRCCQRQAGSAPQIDDLV